MAVTWRKKHIFDQMYIQNPLGVYNFDFDGHCNVKTCSVYPLVCILVWTINNNLFLSIILINWYKEKCSTIVCLTIKFAPLHMPTPVCGFNEDKIHPIFRYFLCVHSKTVVPLLSITTRQRRSQHVNIQIN